MLGGTSRVSSSPGSDVSAVRGDKSATRASCPYRALIGLVLNADALLAGRRFGGQSACVAGDDAVGALRCCGGVEYVVETGVAGVTDLVG